MKSPENSNNKDKNKEIAHKSRRTPSTKPIRHKIITSQSAIRTLIHNILTDDFFFARFKKQPYKTLDEQGVTVRRTSVTKNFIELLKQVREIAVIESIRQNVPLVRLLADRYPERMFIEKSATKSKTLERTHNNWDLTEKADVLHKSMESTKPGYITVAEEKSSSGIDKKFTVKLISIRLIENFDQWALIRPEVMEEIVHETSRLVEKLNKLEIT